MKDFFIWLITVVYNRLIRVFNRIYFSEEEIMYLIDIIDIWSEGYKETASSADDDEISTLHGDMSTAMEVRDKLWRQLNV